MVLGALLGVLGAKAMLWFMRRVSLPDETLYPLRTCACVFVVYGATTLVHGSGFLAVFVAGILVGDEKAPYKADIVRFHAVLASLAEIVAFVVLGLTIDVSELSRADVWLPGLLVGASMAVVIRPVAVALCLARGTARANERAFVMFAGLKGAVPLLLGGLLLTSHVEGANRLYGVVIVAMAFSVIVQGGLIATVADRLRLPNRPGTAAATTGTR
jgi:cell volume regulation protein A